MSAEFKPSASRRQALKLGAASAASLLASPAIANTGDAVIEWKMVTSWQKNLPGPGTTAQTICDRIEKMSGGRMRVRLFAAGELVPPLGVFDAVSAGTAQVAHTASFLAGQDACRRLVHGHSFWSSAAGTHHLDRAGRRAGAVG
ncbi:hypothetical protein [Pannonibacter phragmitetus]|uniref:hypothetical protein n=1 Tax=Pannonibacter phragmitetus TaxID=121719 RepID=UPI003D2EA4D5